MLTQLRISNFKPFGPDLELPLRPVTLIFGPNSAGKSSVIQSLLLLKQSLAATGAIGTGTPPLLPANGPDVQLGSFGNLIHRHETDRALQLGYSCTRADGTNHDLDLSWKHGELCDIVSQRTQRQLPDLELSLTRMSGSFPVHYCPETDSTTESLLRWLIAQQERRALTSDTPLQIGARASKAAPAHQPNKRHLDALTNAGLSEGHSTPLPTHPYRNAREQPQNLVGHLQSLESAYNFECLENHWQEATHPIRTLQHAAPIRPTLKRSYLVPSSLPTGSGHHEDAAIHQLHLRGGLLDQLNNWLTQLGVHYRAHLETHRNALSDIHVSLILEDTHTDVRVNACDVGFGIGQILPILVQGITRSGESTSLVEQPELHLHPRLQAELADLILSGAGIRNARPSTPPDRRGLTSTQWIIETHSEAMLMRIQRRIRKGEVHPDNVCLLFVDAGASASVQRLTFGDDGELLDPWPDGFFEEAFNEIFADE